jgi:hypothetical protein
MRFGMQLILASKAPLGHLPNLLFGYKHCVPASCAILLNLIYLP